MLAYKPFSNGKFSPEEIYFSHHKEAKNRINGKEFVFAVQDCKSKSLHFRFIMSNLVII